MKYNPTNPRYICTRQQDKLKKENQNKDNIVILKSEGNKVVQIISDDNPKFTNQTSQSKNR